jgi:hypothetical protein
MHFITTWTFKPEHAKDVSQRFLDTGGTPPEGITLIGRWHDVSSGRGFSIVETDDPIAISKWCHQWYDLLSFEIIPVVDDKQLSVILGG